MCSNKAISSIYYHFKSFSRSVFRRNSQQNMKCSSVKLILTFFFKKVINNPLGTLRQADWWLSLPRRKKRPLLQKYRKKSQYWKLAHIGEKGMRSSIVSLMVVEANTKLMVLFSTKSYILHEHLHLTLQCVLFILFLCIYLSKRKTTESQLQMFTHRNLVRNIKRLL